MTILKTKSDQNTHQNAPNFTTKKISREACKLLNLKEYFLVGPPSQILGTPCAHLARR